MKGRNEEVGVKDLLSIFKPKLWLIVLCAVVLSVIFATYSALFKPDTYTSRSILMLSRDNSTTISTSDIELSYLVIENLGIVMSSRDFLEVVATSVNETYAERGWNITGEELSKCVALSSSGETSVFSIKVTTTDSFKSYAISEVFVSYLLPNLAADTDAPIKSFLPNNYSKINIKCIESPRQVTERNSKGVTTNALIGFLVGGFACALVVYLIYIFDVVIRDRKKLEDHFDIPVIGVIPKYSSDTKEAEEGGGKR